MGEKTTLYCDICGKDIPDFNLNINDKYLAYSISGELIEYDVCDSCLEQVINLVDSMKGNL